MTDEYLDTDAELARKVNDTLIDIISKRESKRISPAQARERLVAVHDCVMGLLDDNLSDLLVAAMKEATELQKKGVRRLWPVLLRNGNNALNLDIDECNPKRFVLMGVVEGSFIDKSKSLDTESDAFKFAVQTLSKLRKSGWEPAV